MRVSAVHVRATQLVKQDLITESIDAFAPVVTREKNVNMVRDEYTLRANHNYNNINLNLTLTSD